MVVLIVLAMVASVLLVFVVLAQNAKGGGLSNQFGGSSAANMIGVKKTGDFLERLTWAFMVAIMLFSLGTNLMGPNNSDDILDKVKSERPANQPANTLPELQNSAKPDSTK
jgi:preprotein translocase subunit SecG